MMWLYIVDDLHVINHKAWKLEEAQTKSVVHLLYFRNKHQNSVHQFIALFGFGTSYQLHVVCFQNNTIFKK